MRGTRLLFVAAVIVGVRPALDAQVLTSQYDNARSGATLIETTLTPANVNAARFGKIFSTARGTAPA